MGKDGGMNDNEITLKAREVARTLSYNEDAPQGAAKHMLLELAHRLDTKIISVHKTEDGLIARNAVGKKAFPVFQRSISLDCF